MTKDMTQGKPLQLILLFSVPLMLGSLFQQFYNMADTIIVGRFVGVEALAAVGSTSSITAPVNLMLSPTDMRGTKGRKYRQIIPMPGVPPPLFSLP